MDEHTEPSAPAPESDAAAAANAPAPVAPEPPAPEPKPAEGDTPAPADPKADPKTPEAPAEGGEGDKPDDPETGDEPPAPDKATEGEGTTETENQTPDLKSMSRAERAQYFQNLEASTRKEVAARVDEVYQPQPVDELKQKYIDQGHTDFEASMLAREEVRDQEADISKARAERAELNASLATEAIEVMSTIDWLNPNKKDSFDQDSADAAADLYDQLCLTRDDNALEKDAQGKDIPGSGQIIGATMTPKQFYGLIDKIRTSGTEGAKLSAQKAAEEQMAAVAPPSSNSSSNKRDKAFDQLSNDEKRAKLRAEGHYVT